MNHSFYKYFTMSQLIYLSAAFCFLAPPILSCAKPGRWGRGLAGLYILGVLFVTVGIRLGPLLAGSTDLSAAPEVELTPFWSYAVLRRADIRWQIWLNILLFVPLGFLLPWSGAVWRRLWRTALAALALSVLTEAAQYILRIGLCETDDVIHNTLGAVIGYGYWRLLDRLRRWWNGRKRGNHAGLSYGTHPEPGKSGHGDGGHEIGKEHRHE